MENKNNIAPVKLEMLMAIVHNDKAAYYQSIIQSHQANLQLTVPAKGTTHLILDYLGLAERPKTLIVSLVRADEADDLFAVMQEQFLKGKDYKGLAFTIPLTSVIGRYYTNTDDAYLHDSVLLRSSTYRMDCDSLRYNASSKIAYFISPTHLVNEENTIFTDRGLYNTDADVSILYGNVQLLGEKQQLFADSIYYDQTLKYGKAWNNARYVDTANHFIVLGNYLEHHEKGGTSIATDSNLLTYIDDNQDTLFLHCDTLFVDFDTASNPTLVRAFFHTKFCHKDIQGACDSMVYNVEDSLLMMYYNPVFWSDNYQLSGDTVRFTILDSVHSTIELCKSGFIVGGLFGDSEFNQIKGLNIVGHLENRNRSEERRVGKECSISC